MNHDQRHRYEWNAIPWRKLEVRVFKLQRRIYQATTRGETRKARRLQKLLATSWSAKSLAVRRVTQENKGKKTAGVDGVKSLTPPQRLQLLSHMDRHTPAKPVRRVWIDKPGKPEKRPLGIPIMHDRATQALVKLALEPEWEAKFEPHSFGCRPGRSSQDAVQQIWETIKIHPRYGLDADIASCFDRINQAALLEKMHTSPHFTRPIKEWLTAGVVDRDVCRPTEDGTPQGGVTTPPTKWQTFFSRVRLLRVRVDPKDNMDLISTHFHSPHQGPDEVALARPVCLSSSVMNLGGKIFETSDNELQFRVEGGFIHQWLPLRVQVRYALPEADDARLTFVLVQEAIRITVNEPGYPLTQLPQLLLDEGQGRVLRVSVWLEPTPVFLGQPFGMGQEGADFLPDRQVEQIRAYLGILTEALATKAIRIGAQAPIRGVRPGVAFAGAGTEPFARVRLAALLALHQALEERERTPLGLPGMALILPPLFLDRRTHLGLHQRGDRDGHPVLLGDLDRRDRSSWLERAPALRPEPRAQRVLAGLAKGRGPHRRGGLSHAPHRTTIPDGLAGPGELPRLGEAPTDRPNCQAIATNPGKDLADHLGFVRDQLIPCLSPAGILRHRAIALGRPAEPMHHAGPCGMPLAPPMAFDDLGALLLRAHPLDLEKQVISRTLASGPVEKNDRDPGAPELIDQQHLIRIFAGQTIRGVDREAIHGPCRHHIAQPLEGRPDEGRPTVPCIQELQRVWDGEALCRHACPQRSPLTGNGLGFGLLLGRDPCIQRSLGGMHDTDLLPTRCVSGAHSACRVESP